jgi:ADP-heptose:LPS heptosyltransferase
VPKGRYAVLHVQASTPLRHWEPDKWLTLADALSAKGIAPVWSAAPNGDAMLKSIDPQGRYSALGHRLDLAQLWHLVARAALLVCPDTSVAHIGKLAFGPTVVLYGPSSAELFGKGEFWRDAPFAEVTLKDFPCRDQQTLFKRKIEWVRRCQRSTDECGAPRCMHGIQVQQVLAAATALGV